MKAVFAALRRGFKGARGIEYLLIAVAVAVVGLTLMSGALPAQEDTRTDLERRMERVLGDIDGAGDVRVMVAAEIDSAEKNPSTQAVRGVLVVAEGAEDLRVYMEIQRAVHALLDVELSSIEIIGMRGK